MSLFRVKSGKALTEQNIAAAHPATDIGLLPAGVIEYTT
jgi:hypothetical protein